MYRDTTLDGATRAKQRFFRNAVKMKSIEEIKMKTFQTRQKKRELCQKLEEEYHGIIFNHFIHFFLVKFTNKEIEELSEDMLLQTAQYKAKRIKFNQSALKIQRYWKAKVVAKRFIIFV
jgi:hypothetical protein